MNDAVISAKAKRNKPITSIDELNVRVIYAEPSEEADLLLDEAIERIYRFGLSQGYFLDSDRDSNSFPKTV